MALINWNEPGFWANRDIDLSGFMQGAELAHRETYSGNRLNDQEVVVENASRPIFYERVGQLPKRVKVNKTTHRIRFENETESEVVVVIEPKEGTQCS